jgi:hypothetical protein
MQSRTNRTLLAKLGSYDDKIAIRRDRHIAPSSPLTSPLREGITRSFSAWLITSCLLFQSLCSVSASAQEPQGSAVALPAVQVNSNIDPAEEASRMLSRNGDGSLPEAPLPQVARAIPPTEPFAFGPSAGTPMPQGPPDSGSGTSAGLDESNKLQGWFVGLGLASAFSGGITLYAAHNDHCSNPPCTSLRNTGQALIGVGAILIVLGALTWHHHPAQHREAAPVGAPPPTPQHGNTLPRAQAIGRNPSEATTTTIRNNTPYTLQVQIGVCPSCLSLTVEPGQNQTVNVNPGQYYETTQALGSNAPPYQGWQTYGAGTDWAETFYMTTQ